MRTHISFESHWHSLSWTKTHTFVAMVIIALIPCTGTQSKPHGYLRYSNIDKHKPLNTELINQFAFAGIFGRIFYSSLAQMHKTEWNRPNAFPKKIRHHQLFNCFPHSWVNCADFALRKIMLLLVFMLSIIRRRWTIAFVTIAVLLPCNFWMDV